MRIDSQLAFVTAGSPLSCVGAAGVTFASSVLDLLGQGVGTAPVNIIGNAALFGTDLGVGDGFVIPKLLVATGTAFVTATSATLNAALQLAPDTAGTHVPGTWQTVVETGALTAAQLAANTLIARFDWPPVFPITLRPRYARMLFTPPSGTDFTAGTIAYANVVATRDDYAAAQAASNYKVQ